MKMVTSSKWIAVPPETQVQQEVVGVPSAEVIRQGELADASTAEGESAEPVSNETEPDMGHAQKLQLGELVCDGETVTFGIRVLGQNQNSQVKLAKVGRKPVGIKLGKKGLLDMTVASGALTMKGLTVEQCAASLVTLMTFRPEVSVDAPSTEVAEALAAAGVTVAIQVA